MASKDTKDKITTAVEFLEQQLNLEAEAGEVLPWNFDQCTHNKGYLRQPVYACKTCKPNAGYGPGGVCYSCSIACHTDHDLVELFNKRSFRCDCGNVRFGSHPCKLERSPHGTNEFNEYNHNFEGRFCWCDEDYDPEKEESNMYQCCICEDWFHERCISGEKNGNQHFTIPELDSFEEYICRSCTSKFPFLKQYKHFHMFFSGQFKLEKNDSNLVDSIPSANTGVSLLEKSSSDEKSTTPTMIKRKVEVEDFESTKRPKSESSNCCKREKFPIVNDDVQVDLFCVQGWREDLCRCAECVALYKQHKLEFVLQEEETYEPPKDEDAQTSLFDSGMKVLTQMDRVAAIEGLIAYNKMRDEIREFLQPFVASGKTVTEEDIRSFFEAKLAERKPPDTGSFF